MEEFVENHALKLKEEMWGGVALRERERVREREKQTDAFLELRPVSEYFPL